MTTTIHESINDIIAKAIEAANLAGDKWLEQAQARGPRYEFYSADLAGNRLGASDYMLDLCGNAYIEFKDQRKKEFKLFKQAGFIRYGSTINITHKYNGRQEHGLKIACMEGALEVLTQAGVTNIRMRDYID